MPTAVPASITYFVALKPVLPTQQTIVPIKVAITVTIKPYAITWKENHVAIVPSYSANTKAIIVVADAPANP